MYTIKSQKRVEPEVDESELQTTRYTKQSVNHAIWYSAQLHTHHQDPHLTPTHYYIHFTSRRIVIPFSSLHLANLHPNSLIMFQLLFLEIIDLLRTSNSPIWNFGSYLDYFDDVRSVLDMTTPRTQWNCSHFRILQLINIADAYSLSSINTFLVTVLV